MMYKHKNLRQLLCCVLLLCLFCGSSLGFFSVKAEENAFNPANLYTTYPELSQGVLSAAIVITTSAWNLTQTDVDFEHLYNFTQATIKSWAYDGTYSNDHNIEHGVGKNVTYNSGGSLTHSSTMQKWNIFERDMIVNVVINNMSSDVVQLSSPYPVVVIKTADGHSFSDVQIVDQRSLNVRYVLDSSITFEVGDGHYYYSRACLRPGEHISCTVSIHQCTYTTSNNTSESGSVQLPPNDYPTSAQFINNFSGSINSNISPDELVNYDTKVMNDTLNEIIVALNGQNGIQQTIQNEGDQTQSAITSQTQQDKEQFDEYSAHSDSSDSNNINSAITGGTDAVKEKMGLFSFFDGIVTDLSDTLTKDHERHLVLPALDVPLPEETVHIWDRKEFDFDELENNFGAIITVVRFATVAICYITMINGAYHLFHKFIGVKDSDA